MITGQILKSPSSLRQIVVLPPSNQKHQTNVAKYFFWRRPSIETHLLKKSGTYTYIASDKTMYAIRTILYRCDPISVF